MFFVENESSLLLFKLFFHQSPIFGQYMMAEILNRKVKYHYLLIIIFYLWLFFCRQIPLANSLHVIT